MLHRIFSVFCVLCIVFCACAARAGVSGERSAELPLELRLGYYGPPRARWTARCSPVSAPSFSFHRDCAYQRNMITSRPRLQGTGGGRGYLRLQRLHARICGDGKIIAGRKRRLLLRRGAGARANPREPVGVRGRQCIQRDQPAVADRRGCSHGLQTRQNRPVHGSALHVSPAKSAGIQYRRTA